MFDRDMDACFSTLNSSIVAYEQPPPHELLLVMIRVLLVGNQILLNCLSSLL
jgi:hypothetical protein